MVGKRSAYTKNGCFHGLGQTAMFREKCLIYGHGALLYASVTRCSKKVASGLTSLQDDHVAIIERL